MLNQAHVEDQPGYTGVLQREPEGLVGSSSVSRVSKSVPRNPDYFPGCCGSVKVYEFPREIITTYPECHPDIIHGGEIVGDPLNWTVTCLSNQCYAKKIGVVDGEGYVLPDAFVEVMKSLYAEDSLKTLAKEFAPDCITEANAYAKKELDASGSEERCNEAPYWAQYCVEVGIILECPEDLQINDEECDRIREEINLGLQEWENST
jgi:hypothetical protein